tara:strand:+ start:125 stop:727 length:603 start_codon:yes stop_codon:yes gene_type:complete
MSKQRITIGAENSGAGDTLRAAFVKVNNNFDELYDLTGQDSTGKAIDISGNTISSTFTNTNITLSPNGSGDVEVDSGLVVGGNTVFTLQNNYDSSSSALSLDNTIHSLAAGEEDYTLAAGTEGQIMHFIVAGGNSTAGAIANTTITITQVRNPDDGDVLATYAWKPFITVTSVGDSAEPRRTLATCVFGDGAWNLDMYAN